MEPARIRAVHPEGSRALGIHLDVDEAWRASHTRPGQYVFVAPDVPVALASAPGAPVELLLGAELAARLRPAVGQVVPLSAAEGPGFAWERARGREVVVLAVGSAASAARALVEAVLAERPAFGRVRVFLGAHDAAAHAYTAHDARWRAGGVELWRAHSRPYVHELLLRGDPLGPDAQVFAAGHDAALASARAALATLGRDPAELHLNL